MKAFPPERVEKMHEGDRRKWKSLEGAPLTGYRKQTGSPQPGKRGGLRVRWRWGGTGVADWIIDTWEAEMENLSVEMKEEAWPISWVTSGGGNHNKRKRHPVQEARMLPLSSQQHLQDKTSVVRGIVTSHSSFLSPGSHPWGGQAPEVGTVVVLRGCHHLWSCVSLGKATVSLHLGKATVGSEVTFCPSLVQVTHRNLFCLKEKSFDLFVRGERERSR